ncbi:MAG: DUF1080 domain-containing protein [Verrucomicrobiales bacterium]|nr:DUF1080 domain-containing protein [Verrucomicrobiales bacterium]
MKSLFLAAVTSLALLEGAAGLLQAGPYETILFEDDFEGESLKKEWGSWKSESLIRDGVLVGITPKEADHPSVNTILLPPLSDLEVAVSFKFAGSNRFSIMFRDLDYEGSHAGHICHVGVSAKSIDLNDGKTGQFVKAIRDKRKAGVKLDEETQKMLKTKTSRNAISIDPGEWHDLLIRIEGDVMKAWIDGELVGTLKSEGIAHATKSNMNITTTDREVHYDNFVIRKP